ncbi:MAG: hypothetical protein IPH75_10940 [bacterium]|nr:hypothetical protein [bacterium]
MSKPTIFLSHSSIDKEPLQRLKQLFIEKTGHTIDVFVSVGSNWIYFEAGHAYARGLRVVPVGFLGVDLYSISPPLGLLQGFNIASAGGLNNLITTSNDLFDYRHELSFTEYEYGELCGLSPQSTSSILGRYGTLVDDIRIDMRSRVDFEFTIEEALVRLRDKFSGDGISCGYSKSEVTCFGVKFYWDQRYNGEILNIHAAPRIADTAFTTVEIAVATLRSGGFKNLKVDIRFKKPVTLVDGSHKLSGALFGSGVEIIGTNVFKIGELVFRVTTDYGDFDENLFSNEPILSFYSLSDELPKSQIGDLVGELFERGVLEIGSSRRSG